MITHLQIWLHLKRHEGHKIRTSRVSVPMFDMSAKGILHRCTCGRTWAE